MSFLLFVGSASAATISIEYTGFDVEYNGADITTVGGADSLTAVVIDLDGVQQGPVLTTGLTADLTIPSVLNLAVGGGGATSAIGGSLDLDLGGGDFLDLDLGAVDVTYTDLGFLQLVVAATVATVSGQSLPLGLQIGSPVDVTFLTTVSASADNGTDLTSFTAAGTGAVSGAAIPEPSTIAMLLLATASLVGARRRK